MENLVKLAAPAIQIPKGKWARDEGVTDFIEYFDRPELMSLKNNAARWQKLRANELAEIEKIMDRCRNDFQYAARNFFWITTKDRGQKLFSLWEAQELILEYMMQLKARGISQRVMIIKARQLGCSTLIEALIAWRTMFFQNVTAFVIADEPARAAKLFAIMQYILDRVPWWMQPMLASREYKDGLIFENKNPEDRRGNPGLNSQIIVNAANKLTGVAQGYSVNACHASEFPSWGENEARQIIEEDLGPALAEGPETFAFLEGTAKGAGTYAHRLWIKNIGMGDDARWFPKFLPWFFEVKRVRQIPDEWEPEKNELEMRERVERDWLRCEDEQCHQFHERFLRGLDRDGDPCPTCEKGTLKAYYLTNEQCAWMGYERKNAQGDVESVNNLRQEMCLTAEEAFQVSGVKVFSDIAQDWVMKSIEEPFAKGNLDKKAEFHGCDPRSENGACFHKECSANHRYDPAPLQIWRWPQRGRKYVIGGDVAEGLGGEGNYSVAFVMMIGDGSDPDEQVATYRSNDIDPIGFAQNITFLGHFYNKALVAVEGNKYDTAAMWVQETLAYPNCYRERLAGSGNSSVKVGWQTTEKSKRRLYTTMKRWLEYRQLKVRSRNFAEEMKTFKREDNEKGGAAGTLSAARGFFDDELMAGMIALFVAHAGDYDENLGYIAMKAELTMDSAQWHMRCASCQNRWPAETLQSQNNCPNCRSMHISGVKNPQYQVNITLEDLDSQDKTIEFYNKSWDAANQGLNEPASDFKVPDYDSL